MRCEEQKVTSMVKKMHMPVVLNEESGCSLFYLPCSFGQAVEIWLLNRICISWTPRETGWRCPGQRDVGVRETRSPKQNM